MEVVAPVVMSLYCQRAGRTRSGTSCPLRSVEFIATAKSRSFGGGRQSENIADDKETWISAGRWPAIARARKTSRSLTTEGTEDTEAKGMRRMWRRRLAA